MITPPAASAMHLASAWTAGIALFFIGVGLQGALTPLVPNVKDQIAKIETGDEVMLESFNPPAAPAPEENTEPKSEEPFEEIEIPQLPEIVEPLTPPEMVELTPLEEVIEKPKKPEVKPPKPRPVSEPRPVAREPAAKPAPASKPGGNGGSSASAGSRKGSFPQPPYPSAARSAGLQGTVRLRVVVESSGLPSSVSVTSSSGHSVLDAAARDHVQRRWRWPSGETRSYTVPVKFVLQ